MKSLILTVSVLVAGCSAINKDLHLPNDNIGEQMLEMLIEKETGVKVDFTPSTAKGDK